MTKIYFQLGRERELCRFELLQIMRLHGLELSGGERGLPWVENPTASFDLGRVCDELGGCVRAIEDLGEFSGELLARFRTGDVILPDGPWGVSSLDPGLKSERSQVREEIRECVRESDLAHGREERPKPGELEISPARVFETELHRSGAEICLFKGGDGRTRAGITRWVFDPRDFGKRDVEKPFRPQKRGLLPPKLARQMINLGRTSFTWRMLDPFCGSGVTLIEGLGLGLQVAGADNRDEALRQSRKNLEWFLPDGHLQSQQKIAFLERIDVRQLSTKVEPLSFDLVVGEGDLGPPIRGKLSRKAAVEFSSNLDPLYTKAFAEIRTVLKPGGRASLAIPFWQPNEGDPIFINLERKLRLIGYAPAFEEKEFDPFLYRRPDQRVGRAIYVLKSPE